MNRDQLSELLSAYIDGEVDDRERALVERVLRDDAAAQRLLEELRRSSRVVASLPRHAAPATLVADLEAQLERADLLVGIEEPSVGLPDRGVPWTAWMGMAATLGVVVAAGWWFLLDHGQRGFSQADRTDRGRIVSSEPTPPPAAPGAAGDGAMASRAVGLTVEAQLAAGVDPTILMKQSFEPEAVRLQVVARDASERDALADKLVSRLSEQRTENLAKRGRRASGIREPIGSFFLVGKPGVNFDDLRQRQVLVRVLRSQTAQVVDELTTVAGSEDRVALRAGPVAVRGAAPSRKLLQMVGQTAPEADSTDKEAKPPEAKSTEKKLTETETKIVFADKAAVSAKERPDSNGFNILDGLLKVVGLDGPSPSRSPGGHDDPVGGAAGEDKGSARDADAVAAGPPAREEATDESMPAHSGAAASPPPVEERVTANEGAEVTRPGPSEMKDGAASSPQESPERSRSLVARRQGAAEKARAKTTDGTSTVAKERKTDFSRREDASKPLAASAKSDAVSSEPDASAAQGDYVTLVIEFVVPSPRPESRPPASRPSRVPPPKSSR